MNWVVYMLECKDNSIYTGIAKNLENRLSKHQSGNGAKYLRGRLPIKLMYKEFFKNRSDATKREIFIKKMNKQEKIFLINTKNLI
ncbi:GIY-YIG nuclease family protein [Alphaproteobacteria bacterium]|jgi:putative endonuclease|nr:GIY-YIG nuclease family protein [Alphaproteobacteria bacterium]MDB9870282.1 GIY-YIG nuclease family protein [Alphaproteobacteria bacterium]|tara:strand:+ start:252 stop:506 length:255 start_codon:yes stop_codon:yes gene_type:complete